MGIQNQVFFFGLVDASHSFLMRTFLCSCLTTFRSLFHAFSQSSGAKMNIFLTFYVGQIALIHVQVHFYLLSYHHFVLRGCKKSEKKTEEKKTTHFELHRAAVWPAARYVLEIVTRGKRQEAQLEAVQMKVLSFSLRATRIDIVWKEQITVNTLRGKEEMQWF